MLGGLQALPGEFPECCSLFTNQWHGSGVLVAPRIVLTAAHCLTPLPKAVALGVECVRPADQGGAAAVVASSFNPAFTGDGAHDIAFVALAANSPVQPVPMASTEEISSADEVTLVGFGYDEFGVRHIKRSVKVKVHFVAGGPQGPVPDAVAAARFDPQAEMLVGDPGKGACTGDSGGPVYVKTPQGRKLAGLISRGPGTSCAGLTIIERIDAGRVWIEDVIAAY